MATLGVREFDVTLYRESGEEVEINQELNAQEVIQTKCKDLASDGYVDLKIGQMLTLPQKLVLALEKRACPLVGGGGLPRR